MPEATVYTVVKNNFQPLEIVTVIINLKKNNNAVQTKQVFPLWHFVYNRVLITAALHLTKLVQVCFVLYNECAYLPL